MIASLSGPFLINPTDGFDPSRSAVIILVVSDNGKFRAVSRISEAYDSRRFSPMYSYVGCFSML